MTPPDLLPCPELKPCPFCGSEYQRIATNNGGDYYVICEAQDESEMSCGAMSDPENCETIEKAARRWNRRAEPAGEEVRELACENCGESVPTPTHHWKGRSFKACWICAPRPKVDDSTETLLVIAADLVRDRIARELWDSFRAEDLSDEMCIANIKNSLDSYAEGQIAIAQEKEPESVTFYSKEVWDQREKMMWDLGLKDSCMGWHNLRAEIAEEKLSKIAALAALPEGGW